MKIAFLVLSICMFLPERVFPFMEEISNDKPMLMLNPQYSFRRNSDGSVLIKTIKEKKEEALKFTDFYADLLLGLYRKQKYESIGIMLQKKYYLSDEECRRQMKHAINVLSEWKIIVNAN